MLKSTRDGFGEALLALGKSRENIYVIDADLKESLRVSAFAQKYPDRFIECGVAEQNMIGVAAGLALTGKTVFATSFASFSPAISWNSIRIAVCYSKANVKIIGSHAGLATGMDGASHQALEDIALMRVLPNMTILVPADCKQARELTKLAAEYIGPVYLRLARPETEEIRARGQESKRVKVGGSEILRKGNKLTIIGCGIIFGEVMKAAEKLDAEVINCYSVKPIDEKTILESAKKTGRVVAIEDHSVIGGLGGAITELLSEKMSMPILRLGVNDVFGESARDYLELWKKHGLTSGKIIERINKWI
jgi:transketolase